MKQPLISFIIPAYNEAVNISSVFQEITKEMSKQSTYNYEVIYVDDGSTDDTLHFLQQLTQFHPQVKYISFTRNFGKEAAIFAGLQHAKGNAVIMMDADLQHPPTLIHDFLAGFEEGYDQVIAKRDRTGDSKVRSFLSSLYYRIVNKIVDVNLTDGEGDFRLLSRKAVQSLLSLSEGNRFSKGFYSWIGLDCKIVTYQNVTRKNGQTKWSLAKLFNYGLDGIFSFNQKPLRFCFYLGFFILSISLLYILFILVDIMLHGISVPGYFTVISAVLFLGGIQLVSLGIIGEYIGRIYFETKKRPHYLVKYTNIEHKEIGEHHAVH